MSNVTELYTALFANLHLSTYFRLDLKDSESTIDTVSDGTCAASSTQWFSVTQMGNSSHVNSDNFTCTIRTGCTIENTVRKRVPYFSNGNKYFSKNL